MKFIDTNYFLRFFLGDNLKQSTEVEKLFRKGANGDEQLFTSIIVFFELFWVTTSFYQKQKEDIVTLLKNVLKMDFVALAERPLLSTAVKIFAETNLGLEDAYNLTYALIHEARDFETFDIKLRKKYQTLRK